MQGLNKRELEILRQLYRELSDYSGLIDFNRMRITMKELDLPPDTECILKEFENYDVDNKGGINFEQFAEVVSTSKSIKYYFNKYKK